MGKGVAVAGAGNDGVALKLQAEGHTRRERKIERAGGVSERERDGKRRCGTPKRTRVPTRGASPCVGSVACSGAGKMIGMMERRVQ